MIILLCQQSAAGGESMVDQDQIIHLSRDGTFAAENLTGALEVKVGARLQQVINDGRSDPTFGLTFLCVKDRQFQEVPDTGNTLFSPRQLYAMTCPYSQFVLKAN